MDWIRSINLTLSDIPIIPAIDILLVAIVVYQVLAIVRGTRAWQALVGVLALAIAYGVSSGLQLDVLHSLFVMAGPLVGFGCIVVFQAEIRRMLSRIGREGLRGLRSGHSDAVEEIVRAVERMSNEKTGALVVLERGVGLRTFVESGVRMDALLSRDLLLSIFHSGGALHDGAAIVRRDRVAAAACFLPLTINPNFSKDMGTRHRAAIGITEETDCLSIIVSEERGAIAVAVFGTLRYGLTVAELEEAIERHFRLPSRPREVPFAAKGVAAPAPAPKTELP